MLLNKQTIIKIIYILFILPTLVYSQNQLKGRVINSNKKAIELVEIVIKNEAQVISTYTTLLDGEFKFEIPSGNYTISMSYQEEKLYDRNIYVSNSIDLGDVELKVKALLDEVVVTQGNKKKLIVIKSDKYIVNVENRISAVGTDVMTLLSKTPGVRVSKGSIKLSGKSELLVSINGKVLQLTNQDLEDYLKSISSSDVSKIEVITNPSSKYDAQGSSGILNIILKKGVKKGYGGTITSTFSKHKFSNYGNNINMSYNGNKTQVNSSLNYEFGTDFVQQEVSTYFYNIQSIGKSESVRDLDKINFNADVQFDLTKKDRLNVAVLYSKKKIEDNSGNRTDFRDWSNVLKKYNDGYNKLNIDLNKKSINLLYTREIDTLGRNFSVEGDWFQNDGGFSQSILGIDYDSSGSVIPGGTFFENRSNTNLKTDIYSLNVVYSFPTKIADFSVGGKWLYIDLKTKSNVFENQGGIFVYNPNSSSNSFYIENRQALFFSIKKTLNKWNFEGGLRFENTISKGNTYSTIEQPFENPYYNFFPALNIGYNFNTENILSLVYGSRINRAEFRLLNPFRNYYNAYDYWEGNPFVLPSVTNNININYTYKSKHSLDLAYAYTTDGFEQISFFMPNNVVAHKVVNYMNLNSLTLTAATGFKPFKWMDTNFQLQGFRKINNSYLSIINNTDLFGWYMSLNNNMALNKSKTVNAEINFWYSSGNLELEAYQKKQYSLDLGINVMLLGKDLVIAVNGSDVLRTMWETYTLTSTGIDQKLNNYWQPPTYRLSLQYKFGNRKIEHKNREAENSEEQNR